LDISADWRYIVRHMATTRRAAGRPGHRAISGSLKEGKLRYSITIDRVREGISVKELREVAAELGLSDRKLAETLKIPSRTFDRRLKSGVLSTSESDSLARVAHLLARASKIFGTIEKARGWMSTPLVALDGETPLQRADTSIGAAQVDDLLGRIDYGVYS
jgi:putative toxin-antitoxin system antitoxin component (TIGR02293 family)